MKEVQWISLSDLIMKGWKVATIATAIEKRPLYYYDQFDRQGLANEVVKAEALELLAKYYKSATAHANGQTGPDAPPPKHHLGEIDDPFGRFGWPEDRLPDIAKIQKKLPPSKSDAKDPRSELSLQKMVLGMAIKGYGYNPVEKRSDIISEIVSDLATLGISLSDDTVRKWLKEANDNVERDENNLVKNKNAY